MPIPIYHILIDQHPDWHRTQLSKHLCDLWDWRDAIGRLKDMACRSLLRNKSASVQEHQAYRQARHLNNLSRQSVRQLQTLRRLYDQAGTTARLLLAVLDGGFCNRTVFRANLDRVPAFMVAAYAFPLLASLDAYGAKRTDDYIQPPKWQHRRPRPSCQDLLRQFRKEAFVHPHTLQPLDILISPIAAVQKPAA